MYRRKDKLSNLNNTFASKSSKTLMYCAKRENAGILSTILITHDNRKKKIKKKIATHDEMNNRILTQKKDNPIIEVDVEENVPRININPPQPIRRVIINWLILPAIESATAFILLPSLTYNTLPPYSPMRLGVFRESVTPDSTALKATK